MDLPEPLTPADCDLRGLPFMPLDVVRLVDSDMVALSSGDEFKAAVILWCKSWLQVPAASLPDDDRVLAHLCNAGARWKKIKGLAMHGFVLCSDGRWYHPVVATKAQEAWKHRLSQRERAAKRWDGRKQTGGNATADATAPPTADAVACPAAMQGRGRGTGREEEEGSEPNGSAANAASDKLFWDSAKTYLGPSKSGMIGKWVRDYGRDRAAAAIAQAQVERAVEPISYIEKTLKRSNSYGDMSNGAPIV